MAEYAFPWFGPQSGDRRAIASRADGFEPMLHRHEGLVHAVIRRQGNGVLTSTGSVQYGNHTIAWSATWNTDTMGPVDFIYERTYEEAGDNLRAAVKDGWLVVENSAGMQEIALFPGDLLEYEWAWRVNALKPQFFTSVQAPFAYMLWWDERANESHPAPRNEVLHLYWSEPLDLPAGKFQAHKASLGGQSAWHANDRVGPVRIDDGILIYELEKQKSA